MRSLFATSVEAAKSRMFFIRVMGRTLEHLGVQMYKRRDVAIAELVANSWDAGANTVHINAPSSEEYDQDESVITIVDDGSGMDESQVQDQYLVVGRNRRRASGTEVCVEGEGSRPVMGRKGIGKLAGFGIASRMSVTTWREGEATTLTLNVEDLKGEDNSTDNVPIEGWVGDPPADADSPAGTAIELRELKHKTPLDLDALKESLGRRFSRLVLGRMKIYINGEEIGKPHLNLAKRFPEGEEYAVEELSDGSEISYYYAFAEKPIRSPQMRGFTVFVQGKTAQAPPFFFNVEGTASGQHGTRYVTGEIVADFLDKGTDDESDLVSTDRQEIEWDNERARAVYEWGQTLSRKALREHAAYKGEKAEEELLRDEGLRVRIERLDKKSQGQVSRFLRQLGSSEADPEGVPALADSLVKAFEYRHFHDVIGQIENVGEDPEQLTLLLSYLGEWKVLESRAILEVVKGRLDILEKFHQMIVNNAPETPRGGMDNMHDLMAGYPWLLNPEWQVLAEEKTISRQLREWNAEDVPDEEDWTRYDFLALSDERRLVIIEIKRAGHHVTLDELQRLERYHAALAPAQDGEMYMVMICGTRDGIPPNILQNWEEREDGDIRVWSEIYQKTRRYYEHYRAVLEGDVQHDSFSRGEVEVARTREVMARGSVHRGRGARAEGLGPQDVEYSSDE